jgi:hypothetical protein
VKRLALQEEKQGKCRFGSITSTAEEILQIWRPSCWKCRSSKSVWPTSRTLGIGKSNWTDAFDTSSSRCKLLHDGCRLCRPPDFVTSSRLALKQTAITERQLYHLYSTRFTRKWRQNLFIADEPSGAVPSCRASSTSSLMSNDVNKTTVAQQASTAHEQAACAVEPSATQKDSFDEGEDVSHIDYAAREFGFLPIPQRRRYNSRKPFHFGLPMNIVYARRSVVCFRRLERVIDLGLHLHSQ